MNGSGAEPGESNCSARPGGLLSTSASGAMGVSGRDAEPEYIWSADPVSSLSSSSIGTGEESGGR